MRGKLVPKGTAKNPVAGKLKKKKAGQKGRGNRYV